MLSKDSRRQEHHTRSTTPRCSACQVGTGAGGGEEEDAPGLTNFVIPFPDLGASDEEEEGGKGGEGGEVTSDVYILSASLSDDEGIIITEGGGQYVHI